ncbi:hypothetical protein [Haploplasma axanthum]|uniref:Sporadically distributed protein n=1 Tax=Haploplasma axanthum TaxID=29552 RepID=A0A449BBU8_HAPAX|nr:hypothetical protein [Haploplasma axanthum]VEU79909.1 sporadically distributed protein [Haploplasma axanthum]
MSEKSKLTVYLIRKEINLFDDIVEEGIEKLSIDEQERIYYKKSYEKTPSWLKTFFNKSKSNLEEHIKNSSSNVLWLKKL